jgi:hypothetical protein
VHVGLDDAVGCVEDVAGGAVVLLELHHGAGREAAIEGQDVLDVGAAKRVDGLVVVAHHGEVLVGPAQQPDDVELQGVRVLILVDVQVLEEVLVALADVGRVLEEFARVEEQVVEVDGRQRPQM